MLIIERKAGESLEIKLKEDIDPNTPVGEIFNKPIEIVMMGHSGPRFKFGINAPLTLSIMKVKKASG